MKSFRFFSDHESGKVYTVAESVRKVYCNTHAIYLPKGTSYKRTSYTVLEIGTKKIEALSRTDDDPDSYATIYIPVGGIWVAKPRVKQAPESLTTQKNSFRGPDYTSVDFRFWSDGYVLEALKKEPSFIELFRDLGMTFINAEQLAHEAGLTSLFVVRYPKSKVQNAYDVSYGGSILEARGAIMSWVSSPDTFNKLLKDSFIVCEEELDIGCFLRAKYPRSSEKAYEFITDCLKPLVQTCKARDFVLKFHCNYPIGADSLLPEGTLIGKVEGGSRELFEAALTSADYLYADNFTTSLRLRWLANKKVIHTASYEEDELDSFTFGIRYDDDEDYEHDEKWLKDYLDPRDIPQYVVRYLTKNKKSVLRLLRCSQYFYSDYDVLAKLREYYLWHYADHVASAMYKHPTAHSAGHSRDDLCFVFPKIVPNGWIPKFYLERNYDEPALVLPAISASRPERRIDWSLDFSKTQYKGTAFKLLRRPHETTREHYALMVSSLPIGNIYGLDADDLGWSPAVDGKPTLDEWTYFLDHFYEITAPRRTLSSIPVKDRTYSVCKCYPNHTVAELALIPATVLWKLASESPYDPRYVGLELLYQPDERLTDMITTESGYLATLLERVHGDGESPILKDPFLITKLCYLGAPINSLASVPNPFRSPGICDAYWRANPCNLEFVPAAMRTPSML